MNRASSWIRRPIDAEPASRGVPLKSCGDAWLSFAATPTFAAMALLTGIHGDGMSDMLCSAAPHASVLTGMATMYLLMSAFHSAPWLRLLGRWSRGVERVRPSRH